MNSAPLPQPAPFTCPNCGASLDDKPEFCPRCAARLNADVRPSLSIFAAIFLALGLLVFGAIGACGALVTAGNLAGQNGEYQGVLLAVSVPSLLVGLIGFALCLRPFLRRNKR